MVLNRERADAIRSTAHQVREDIVRMVHAAKCGHPGGPLGMADFMATLFVDGQCQTLLTCHEAGQPCLFLACRARLQNIGREECLSSSWMWMAC